MEIISKTLDNIKYTWNHKIAFLKVEKELLGRNTIRGYLHDLDKIFVYLIFDKILTHKVHRATSKHHTIKAETEEDYIQMVIDWECARITKPDKLLNAQETLYKFYPELENKIVPILLKLNLMNLKGGENKYVKH